MVSRGNRLIVVAFVKSQKNIHGQDVSAAVILGVWKNAKGDIFPAKDLVLRQRPVVNVAADPAALGYLLHIWIRPVIKVRKGVGLFDIELHISLDIALGPDQLMGAAPCPHLDHVAEYIIKPVQPNLEGLSRADPGEVNQVCEATGS